MRGSIINMNEDLQYRDLQKTAVITIILNIILTIAKLIIGVVSKSTAVISDGIHSLSDGLTTIFVMIGLKFSNVDPDEEHQYGHQRIESIVSFLLAISLALTGVYIGFKGVQNLIERESIIKSHLALAITIISILFKELMYQYTYRKAKKYNSSSLMADAWHHRTDGISSVAVLIGLIGAYVGLWYMEPVATIVVCIIILKASYDIGKVAVDQLIDKAVDSDTLNKIEHIILSVSGVKKIDLLQTRISNNLIFVETEILVDSTLNVVESHDIAKEVHDLLEEADLSIKHCMVHVNPDIE